MVKFIRKTYFIFLPLIITAAALALNLVRYGAVDDILMYNMATSYSFNAHSEHLMFINIALGYLLKFLYGITGAINWFSILYLILYNLAFITFFKLFQNHKGNIIYIIILSCVEFYLLLKISFTVISFLLACAGMMWFLNKVDKLDKKNIKHIIYSLILFLLAFAMRNGSTLYCILLVFIPTFVFAVKNKKNSAAAVALAIVLCIASEYGVTFLNEQYSKTIPENTYFHEFQEYRSAASDNGKIRYKKHKEEFKKAGIKKNDLRLYEQFVYADKKVFNSKMLKTIKDTRDFNDKYNTNIKKIIINAVTIENIFVNYIAYYCLFVLFIFLLYKNKRLEIFSSFVFLALAETYLFVRRRGVVRITDPLAAIGIIILINTVIGDGERIKDLKLYNKIDYKKAFACLTCIVLAASLALSFVCVKKYDNKFKDYSDTVEYIQQDNDHLYIAAPISSDKLFDEHLTLLSSQYENVPVYTIEGEWYVYSYYWYSLMNELDLGGYTDCAINSLLNDNVRFISRNKDLPDYLVKFYKQHYNLKVKYKQVKKFNGGMKVYEFSIADGEL